MAEVYIFNFYDKDENCIPQKFSASDITDAWMQAIDYMGKNNFEDCRFLKEE